MGCCSHARASQKIRARECGVPAAESNRQDGRLCRVEGQQSVGCSESVRADRRVSRPQHRLMNEMAALTLGLSGSGSVSAFLFSKSGEQYVTHVHPAFRARWKMVAGIKCFKMFSY